MWWVLIAFVAGAVIMWLAMTNRGMKPELTEDELIEAAKMIANVCKGDYEGQVDLLEELHRWMDWEKDLGHMSKELFEIINTIKLK